jgi:glycosyltransferase involved in cell wall biosynthesis
MVKILQICNTDFTFNKFLTPHVNSLIKSGFHVECICFGSNIDYSLLEGEVQFHNVRFPKTASIKDFILSTIQVYKVIALGNFDIVNSHNRNSSIVGRVACFFAKLKGYKLVNIYTARGMYFHDNQSKIGFKLTVFIEVFLAKVTDYILCQSKEDVEFMSERYPSIKNKLKYISNGINVTKFNPGLSCNINIFSNKSIIIGTTGRIVRGKGMYDLLQAFNMLLVAGYNVNLLIIGGNIKEDIEPFKDEFMNYVHKNNLTSKVKVTGIIDNVEKYLTCVDIFTLPSYREGVPRSLIEAMSMEKIVVASRIRGAREIIVNKKNGYLFTPHDHKDLYQVLKSVINLPSPYKKNIQASARKTIVSHFNEDIYVKNQLRYIKESVAL